MRYGKSPIDPALGIRPNLLKWLARRPAHAFDATNLRGARAWQRRARSVFEECLTDPPRRVPLRPQVLQRRQMDGYHRTTLLINTALHLKALCWLCMPDGVTAGEPRPAMIATPGHGLGAKDLLAMDEKGRQRPEGQGYQKDYALQAVRLGYPVLVIEPLGFGERRDADVMSGKTGEAGCHAAFALALMLGTTVQRLRMNDIQRGIDYLETMPLVDRRRIGLMGISGGGQMTLWTAAVEPRIKLAVVSGYLNRFRDSVLGLQHCICNFLPNLAHHLDMTDLAALIAPRPLLIESGTQDSIFPIRATRAAARRVRECYNVFGATDRFQADFFEGEHQWSGRKVGKFLCQWL